ncbi:molybdopterin cofactor-binding domain-containing protein [Pleionea sp. CnH1-48]|uniref:xanthine dehydrogenase family protein molybdopterin-binding subunit n=1 Tax=Pleionea sp. CnH1-48 TaxID=2954494 RepID=UPI0020975772|nr:molybdopterin cofactor-binding domain-containing protein [Pleionea sp. CnH1-48]MCO7226725.1 molybdopterin-dependent oxidoreductase [Pleionea sp. CnH1-48]
MKKWTRRGLIATSLTLGGGLLVGVAVRPGNRNSQLSPLVNKENETLVNTWVKIDSNNHVTAIIPHAEMGQGVHTSLAQMLADELDADWSQMKMMEAPAHSGYANYALARGFLAGDLSVPDILVPTINGLFLQATQLLDIQVTGGSSSVRTTGHLGMRVAGAAARELLIRAAAQTWQVEESSIKTEKGILYHPASNRKAPYSEFASVAAKLTPPDQPTLKSHQQFKLMGKSLPRFDTPGKVNGQATFALDIQLDGTLYAAIRQAPVFGATVKSYSPSSIESTKGVVKTVNLENAIAVIATSYWLAQKSVNQLSIEWEEPKENQLSQSDIYQQFKTAITDAQQHNGGDIDLQAGEPDKYFATQSESIQADYQVPYLAHAAMEPLNAVANCSSTHCELWVGSQNPLGVRAEVADKLDMPADDVIVHNQLLGGSFGRRLMSDFAVQAAQLSHAVQKPVKLIWSREEDTQHDFYRPAVVSRFRAAMGDDGLPYAWENYYVDKHDPKFAPFIPYPIQHQKVVSVESPTHVPFGSWRSVAHSQHAFFTESFFDELAHKGNKDPYQLRHDMLQDSPRMQKVLDLAASKAQWGKQLNENSAQGIAIHKSFHSIVALVAQVSMVNNRLKIEKVTCAVDVGFAINPDGLKAQMESGIIFGLTAALFGNITIEKGAVKQSNFHDYPMLRMNQCPEINVHILNSGEPTGGAGEPSTPVIAPAVTNAIFSLTGTRIRELPINKHFSV